MGRTEQGAAFDAILASGAFQSCVLFDFTLADATVLHLSDVPCTLASEGVTYEPVVRDVGEWSFSQGQQVDGGEFIELENTSGIFGFLDEQGVSPFAGATVVIRYAVSYPGADEWEVDTVTEGLVRFVEINESVARMRIVPDYADPAKFVSGEIATLEELTPSAPTIGTGAQPGGGVPSNGWPHGGYLDTERTRLDIDNHSLLFD